MVGIEIDYSTMVEQVDNITLYDNGYAFINDADGNIIYHPHMDVLTMDEPPKVPEGLLSSESSIRYTFEGMEKQAVWLPLSNGMRLNVTVPVSEINGNWHRWVNQIFVAAVILLVVFIAVAMRLATRICRPLAELTEAASRVDSGDYDVIMDYKSNDEVGILAR